MFRYRFIVFIILILHVYSCTDENSKEINLIDNGNFKLPAGFKIEVYSDALPGARSMALSPSGVLYVGTRDKGVVYAVVDTNKDYRPDNIYIIANGLNSPNGVAFLNGSLYVAEINRILRFDNIESNLSTPPQPVIINSDFPSDITHGWKYIAFGPDGKLYVPVGAPCNICYSENPEYASIMRLNADGSGLELFASGVRNTVGFDWNPLTKELWFTDNGRDLMGDNIPPDELNRAYKQGLHFGYPFVHGIGIRDPEFGTGRDLSIYEKPMIELGPHVAALGMKFYTGTMFPIQYKNQIFIAEHGSWNRTEKIGYRVTLVNLDGNGKAIGYKPFIEGWLKDGSVSGRPVDILILQDGSMLISDDYGGKIYRVTYHG